MFDSSNHQRHKQSNFIYFQKEKKSLPKQRPRSSPDHNFYNHDERKNVSKEEIAEIIKYLRYSQKAAGLEPEDEEEEDG